MISIILLAVKHSIILLAAEQQFDIQYYHCQ